MQTLIDQIDDCLAQTQCQKCGYESCRAYAEAVAGHAAPINRCPPGGTETLNALSALMSTVRLELDPQCGVFEGFRLAVIDEQWCIGCTVCIQKCPVDAIVGAGQKMHTVIAAHCTGCELCVEPCPTDCIEMVSTESHPNYLGAAHQWTRPQRIEAKRRFEKRQARLRANKEQIGEIKHRRRLRRASATDKRGAIAAALARVEAKDTGG